jgi:hypothetical protein
MPMVNKKSYGIENKLPKLRRGWWHRVNATFTWPMLHHLPHFSVFDQERRGIKLNKHIIIKGKFMNEDKIFADSGYMKNVVENKITMRGGNNRSNNVRNLHTCPISPMNLIGAIVGIVHGELVKLTCKVGGVGVGVPIVVEAVGGGCGYCRCTLLGNVLLVTALPACGHRMPDLKTDLH